MRLLKGLEDLSDSLEKLETLKLSLHIIFLFFLSTLFLKVC